MYTLIRSYFSTLLSIASLICLFLLSSKASPITFDPTNELGVFVNFNPTNLSNLGDLLDSTIPGVASELSLGHGSVRRSQFYAFNYGGSTTNFSVFATYQNSSGDGNQWLVADKIEKAINYSAPQLVNGEPVVTGSKILVSKLNQTDTANLTLGFRGAFTAKPDKIENVQQFLFNLNPVIQAESYAPVWLVMQDYDENGPTATFEAINFFRTAEDQQAHLDGKIPAAFRNISDTLLIAPTTRINNFLNYYEA